METENSAPPDRGWRAMWGKLWVFEDPHLNELKNKRVLVTGASRGVGEQLAYHFASHGCTLVLTARNQEALHMIAKKCTEISGSHVIHHVIPADMADMNATKTLIEETVKQVGGIDILVLNHITVSQIQAYTGSNDDIIEMDRQMDINFRSYAHLASHALPELTASHGRIVVISSLVGKIGHPFLLPYAASKFALDGFFSSMRNQFLAENIPISVTMCFLGLIGTEQALYELERSGNGRTKTMVKPESPSAAADAIVRATASRQRELNFPYLTIRPLVLLYTFLPRFADFIMRYASSKS